MFVPILRLAANQAALEEHGSILHTESQLVKNLGGVLPESRGRRDRSVPQRGERTAWEAHAPERGEVDLDEKAPIDELRVRHELDGSGNGRGRDVAILRFGNHVLLRVGHGPAYDSVEDDVALG